MKESNSVNTDSSVIPELKSSLMILGQNVLNRLNNAISGAKQRPIHVEKTSSSIHFMNMMTTGRILWPSVANQSNYWFNVQTFTREAQKEQITYNHPKEKNIQGHLSIP